MANWPGSFAASPNRMFLRRTTSNTSFSVADNLGSRPSNAGRYGYLRRSSPQISVRCTLFTLGKIRIKHAGTRMNTGGGGEIRTHGRVPPSLVFKTSALNHSATPPFATTPARIARAVREDRIIQLAMHLPQLPRKNYCSSLRKICCKSFRKHLPSSVGLMILWSR